MVRMPRDRADFVTREAFCIFLHRVAERDADWTSFALRDMRSRISGVTLLRCVD